MKKQNDFSFEEAKELATHHLSELAKFMQNMNDVLPFKVPIHWAIELQTLELRVSKASSPCLHENDIRLICELAQQLTQANPDTSQQLTQFWNLYAEVFNILKSNPKNAGYAPRGIIIDNWTQIEKADLLAENLVAEFKRNPATSNYASLMAVLASHIDRTEGMEYSIRKQLKDAVKKYNLKTYDVDMICSIRQKVKMYNKKLRKDEWTTDVRAIRNSIAHSQYSIRKIGEVFEISFDNDKMGYNFHEVFSQKDFYKFFDLHTLLYKLQLTLLIIIELLPILTTHLLKKPSTN